MPQRRFAGTVPVLPLAALCWLACRMPITGPLAKVILLCTSRSASASVTEDILVLANPNNLTSSQFAAGELLHWHDVLAAKGELVGSG